MSLAPVPKNRRVLALIPARGGSKGVPRKNLRPLGGVPLIRWTLEAASGAKRIDRIVVSTDDPEILAVAEAAVPGSGLRRPSVLATDESPSIDPVLHALENFPDAEWLVLLQPTSPFRSADDIDRAVEIALQTGGPVVSVCETEKSPYLAYRIDDPTRRIVPIVPDVAPARRQDLPRTFSLNGAVYVASRDFLIRHRTFVTPETAAYVMPPERSADIDTAKDFEYLEWVLERRGSGR